MDTPYLVGTSIGILVFTIPLLLGIVKCISIMRRPTTSTLCVIALALALSGWVLTQIGTICTKIFALPEFVNFITIILAMLAWLVALIVGIIGLVIYDRQRFVQGRSQATWAIVLSSLMILLVIGGGVLAFFMSRTEQMTLSSSKSSCFEDTYYENKDLNFSIQAPEQWFSVEAKSMHPMACCGFRRRGVEAYSIIIGENVGGVLNTDQLKEIVKAHMKSNGQINKQTEETVKIGDYEFVRLSTHIKLTTGGHEVYYDSWLITYGDFSWQIMMWGKPASEKLIIREARQLAENFKVLDKSLSTGSGSFEDRTRLPHGYFTKLAGMGWSNFVSPNLPLVDTLVQRVNECVSVTPLHFNNKDEGVEIEMPSLQAIGTGCLSMIGIPQTEISQHLSTEWQPDTGRGLEFIAENRIDNDDFVYIFRIIQGEKMSHAVIGWYLKETGDEALVRRSMDAVSLTDPVGEPQELGTEAKRAWAIFLNDMALHYNSHDEKKTGVYWLRQSLKQNPKDVVVFSNLMDTLITMEADTEARAVYDEYNSNYGKDPRVTVLQARLMMVEDNLEDAHEVFLQAIENGYRNDDTWVSWMTELSRADRPDLAAAAADAYAIKNPTILARRWQAQFVKNAEEYERALSILEKLAEEYPTHLEVACELAEACNDAGDYTRAEELANKLIAKNKKDYRSRIVLGWSQVGKKWYREAKATFEGIASEKPDHPDVQDAIKYVSAMLGQGDNSAIKTVITPIPVPDDLQKIIDENRTTTEAVEGRSTQKVLRIKSYHFEKGKPLRKTITQRFRVLNAEGVNELSSYQFSFDPLYERVHLNSLDVFDANGEKIAHGSANDAYVLDASQDMHDDDKTMHLPVPSLSPGCEVEVTITTETLSAADHFTYENEYFVECDLSAVIVTGDISEVKHELNQGDGISFIQSPKALIWHGKSLPALHYEPLSVPATERVARLALAGDEGSWDTLVKEYLTGIKDRLNADSSVEKLAAEITKDLQTDAERLDALARYVQKQISYQAIEFGIRARRPNTAEATLRNRYGDCKDQSLLLHQLLQAVNIESHLTLVSTNLSTDAGLPSLDQFNHMVLHVPMLGEDRLIDPTDKYLHAGAWQADNLWHSQPLVLDAEKPRLLSKPTAKAASSRMHSRRIISPDGDHWTVQEVFTLEGYTASWMRQIFSGMDVKNHIQQGQSILSQNGEAQLHEFRFDHLEDTSKPAVLHMTYTARNLLRKDNDKTSGSLPAFMERHYIDLTFLPDRKTDFILRYPYQFRSDVTLKLPATLDAATREKLAQKHSSKYCNWESSLQAPETSATNSSELHIQFKFDSPSNRYPASAYSECREAWEEARHWWSKPVQWATP